MRYFLLLLFLLSCSQPIVHNLDAVEFKDVLDRKEELGAFVVNVHTPYEGEIEGTDVIIEDWEDIAGNIDKLPQDKSAPLLVYCRSGRMSESAVNQLVDLGYSNIYHLKGGMRSWDASGFSIKNKNFE